MMTMIKKVMSEGLIRYAKKNGLKASEVQILIYFEPQSLELPKYAIVKNWEIYKYEDEVIGAMPISQWMIEKVTFNQILDILFDLIPREMIAASFISQMFYKMAQEQEMNVEDISAAICCEDEEAKWLGIIPFDNRIKTNYLGVNQLKDKEGKPITLSLADLFGGEE